MKTLRITLVLLFVTSVFSAFAPNDVKSFKYSTEEGEYSVKFACEFKIETTDNNGTVTEKAVSECGDAFYLSSYTLHVADMSVESKEDLHQISIDSFNETAGTELVSKEEWKTKKGTGIKSILQSPGADMTLEYRVLISGQHQYQFVALVNGDELNEKATSKFFKSIKFKK